MKNALYILAICTICLAISACGRNDIKEIKIGKQVWMDKNLDLVKFQNGDEIPEAADTASWFKYEREGKPCWCIYDNFAENGKNFGKIYNYYAIADKRGLAPKGWRIPTEKDFKELLETLKKMDIYYAKTIKTNNFWIDSGSDIGTNTTGFSAVPGGFRSSTGEFKDKGSRAEFWSTTEQKSILDEVVTLLIRADQYDATTAGIFKSMGCYVRCIKN